MSNFLDEWYELERLAVDYDSRFGAGKSDEIIEALMIAYSTKEQIDFFNKADGREIIVTPDETALDAVKVTYK